MISFVFAFLACSFFFLRRSGDGDPLLDVHLGRAILQRYAPAAEYVVDETPGGFHGRWLVEMWCGGMLWGAPCAQRCVGGLLSRLGEV